MVKAIKKYLFIACVFSVSFLQAQVRTVTDFNAGWKFYLGNDSTASNEKYVDASWRVLNLPHDWSIESDFIKDAPATNQGGSLPGGIGWYRKAFVVPASTKDKNVSIEFDGVYQNSEVWINGHYLGKRPNGYVSFEYELSPYLKFGTEKNIVAVKVDNSQQPNSRWYSGSGIYRNVKLVTTNQVAVKQGDVFITTGVDSKKEADVTIETKVSNSSGKYKSFNYYVAIYDASGKLIKELNDKAIVDILTPVINKSTLKIINPNFWSTDRPYLYKAVVKIIQNGKSIDEYVTTFGIRSFQFDVQKGFYLNNQPLKIKGVCMHHDLGALGAAFNKSAAKRSLVILKEMGGNSLRFSLTPPAADIRDLCDEMGFLVIDEAFDMWKKKKNKYDYYKDFTEWHKRDLEAMIHRDRNHPSIIAWSIGNEIREQFDSTGTIITKELVDIVKQIDPTRPVITALTETMPEKNFIAKAVALDLLGFNYKDYDYKYLPQRFPNQKFIATETASALATRGVYQFPSDSIRIWPPDYKVQDTFMGNKDHTASAYDNTHAYWGGTHEKTWLAVKKYPHMTGIFVWSGFDFLGEPVPYPKFPSRSSYYGIVDLAGFPKDVYYMYQSEWTTKPVLHIFPHWNWKKGELVDIWAYYNNADEVELFLNNKSVGKRTKTDTTLHLMWRIPFEPGTVKAVSKKNGKIVLTKQIKTAGEPAKIELTADRTTIKGDSKDLSFISARILDKAGNLVPDTDNLITFSVSPTGIIAGTDNGYQADTVSLKSTKRKVWKGMALAIVKSSGKKGNITLRAISPGLAPAEITLKTSY